MEKTALVRRIAASLAQTSLAKEGALKIASASFSDLLVLRQRRQASLVHLEKMAQAGKHPGEWALVANARRLVAQVDIEIAKRTGSVVTAKDEALEKKLEQEMEGEEKPEEAAPEEPAAAAPEEAAPEAEPAVGEQEPETLANPGLQKIFDATFNQAYNRVLKQVRFLKVREDAVLHHPEVRGDLEDLAQKLFLATWPYAKKTFDPKASPLTQTKGTQEAFLAWFSTILKGRIRDMRDQGVKERELRGESGEESGVGEEGAYDFEDDRGAFDRSPGRPDLHYDEKELLSSLPPDLAEPLAFFIDQVKFKGDPVEHGDKPVLDAEGKPVLDHLGKPVYPESLKRPKRETVENEDGGTREVVNNDSARKTNVSELIGAFEKGTGMGWQSFLRRLSKNPDFRGWWFGTARGEDPEPAWKARGTKPVPEEKRKTKKTERPVDYNDFLYGSDEPDLLEPGEERPLPKVDPRAGLHGEGFNPPGRRPRSNLFR